MTFEYTRAGHFQFGYKNSSKLMTRWLSRREFSHETFVARYGRATVREASWRNANTAAAGHILEFAFANRLTPVICCSGGLDSEITLLSFFIAWGDMAPTKRPAIEIATLDFKDDLNRHDTVYVEKFLQRAKPADLDLQFTRYELDVRAFFQSTEFIELADETQVLSPAVLTQIWLCQEIHRANPRALPIIGQGEIHLVREASREGTYEPAVWSLSETENLCGLYRYFIGRGLAGIPGFFQYTPEQFESQLRTNPVLHELIANSRYGKLGTRTSKSEILAFDYPELEARPKYTGFEKIEALYDERRTFLASREGASDAKWLKPVFELMDDLRPAAIDAAYFQFGDWKFAWGRDGEMKSARTSKHDIFASEWTNPEFLRSDSITSPTEFILTIRTFLQDAGAGKTKLTVLHDGNLLARIFHCILQRESKAADSPKLTSGTLRDAINIEAPSTCELARLALLLGTTDADLLTHVILLTSIGQDASNERIVIPLLHGRIVNAEFDLELQSTLVRPRFVWTENEKLAVLANAANHIAPGRCVFPWTNQSLASAAIGLTRHSGWFAQEEPGPSNRMALEKSYAGILTLLEESTDERQFANECSNALATLRKEIESRVKKLRFQYPPNQVSSYDLATFQSSSFNLLAAFNTGLPKNLKLISEETWLEQATAKASELRLGSSLFFQQEVSGFSLLEKNLRAYIALVDDRSHEEVAFAQIAVLRSAPHGRLRIRGVTTREGFERKGFATKLLTQIVTHLRSVRSTHLRGIDRIDVFAAPEVVKAFRSAGFKDDVSRVTRAEEAVDPATGQLVASERELTPLTFSLGET